MQMIEISKLIKSYGDREILNIESLKIYDKEKIGIVGLNGAGKSTLFNLISGAIEPDIGNIKIYDKLVYIKQFENYTKEQKNMSGGEKTKSILEKQLDLQASIILLDEPTNNLDIDTVSWLENKLSLYDGTLLIISHDRTLLDNICTSIIEIENSRVKKYNGNYSSYKEQKEEMLLTKQNEYNKYIADKNKIEKSIVVSKSTSKKLKKAPSRMGNSEARLHKRESTEIVEKLQGHTKALEARLTKLEKKEKPEINDSIYMRLDVSNPIRTKYPIQCENLCISFNEKEVFRDAAFKIKSNEKTAIIGGNGTGKTTLIKEIINGNCNIKKTDNLRIGYFSQELDVLKNDETILQNVLEDSIYSESVCRNILGKLLFKGNDVFKKVNILSGGERVKASFAKIIASDSNLLILDEPTNFLDIESLEALQKLLIEYNGTILFTSHDRMLIDKVATDIMIIDNKKIVEFGGNYSDYLSNSKERIKTKNADDKLLLEFKLIKLLLDMSICKDESKRDKLEEEYKELKNLILDI